MSARVINVGASSASPWSRQRVSLDGRDFVIDLDWNGREGAWFAHVSTAAGELVCGGRKLVAGGTVGRGVEGDPRAPGGRFKVVDTSGQSLDPGIDDLGGRVLLAYIDAADRRRVFGPFPPAAPGVIPPLGEGGDGP